MLPLDLNMAQGAVSRFQDCFNSSAQEVSSQELVKEPITGGLADGLLPRLGSARVFDCVFRMPRRASEK